MSSPAAVSAFFCPGQEELALPTPGCCQTVIDLTCRLCGKTSEASGAGKPETARFTRRYWTCEIEMGKLYSGLPSTYQMIEPGSQSTA